MAIQVLLVPTVVVVPTVVPMAVDTDTAAIKSVAPSESTTLVFEQS